MYRPDPQLCIAPPANSHAERTEISKDFRLYLLVMLIKDKPQDLIKVIK